MGAGGHQPSLDRGGRGRQPVIVGIRAAVRDDVVALHRLVVELATYERAPTSVQARPEDFARALFTDPPAAHALIAEHDGHPVGFALYFRTFSTWTGRQGLHLEDLFVSPEARGLGLGRALLAALAEECVRADLPRLEWNVLDWNEPAIGFYRAIGAVELDQWRPYRLSGPALAAVARGERPAPAG